MPCARSSFDKDGNSHGFMCGEGIVPCAICSAVSEHLCDYPMGKGKTCDAPLCSLHAIPVAEAKSNKFKLVTDEDGEVDLIEFCPQHAAIHGLEDT